MKILIKFVDLLWLQRNQFHRFVRQISHMKLIPMFSMQAQFGFFAVWRELLATCMEQFCLASEISLQLIHFWQVKKAFLFVLQSISFHIQMDLVVEIYISMYFNFNLYEKNRHLNEFYNIPSGSGSIVSKGNVKTTVNNRPKMANNENLIILRCLIRQTFDQQ